MSVSDGHGGGLTLQRVLGDDLDQIRRFIFVRHVQGFPPVARVQSRSVFFVPWFENGKRRRYVGRLLDRLARSKLAARCFARHVARKAFAGWPDTGGQPLRGLICPQAIEAMQVLEHAQRHRQIAYVTWFMDDHLLRSEHGKWGYPAGVRPLMERHLQGAAKVLVISPAMAEFYAQEFGVESTVLIPPADPMGNPAWDSSPGGGPCRLGYFGRFWKWQAEALVKLVENLGALHATLDVYGMEGGLPVELRAPGVTSHGRVPEEQMRRAMAGCDALVLPTSFSVAERNLVDFNIGTKMSEYLASGTVTLLIAPPHAAMTRFLQPHRAAMIVTELNRRAFQQAVEAIRTPAQREPILRAARALVEQQLTTAAIRRTWQEARRTLALQAVVADTR